MALIKCIECGKEVSDRALACPNCGYPISAAVASPVVDRSQEVEKFLNLASMAIQGQNSDQVEKYCQAALEIDPNNSKAWELEARGLLFQSSLRSNKVIQAIGAAANAVNYKETGKEELAVSLYTSIYSHITGLLNNALSMPIAYAPEYVAQCMNYYGLLLSGIPYLPKVKIEDELRAFEEMDEESRTAILPKNRMIYASHVFKPTWAEQYRALLREKKRTESTSAPVGSAPTEKNPNKAETPVSAEIKDGEKVCPKCGTVQKANRRVCWSCGQPFDN